MQLLFSCVPPTYAAIAKTLSKERLERYLEKNQGDHHKALRLYFWNARLCEALYFPAQAAEVAVRNAIHSALRTKHSENWYKRGAFLCSLPSRMREELEEVLRKERGAHGASMTINHLVSGLTLGFWVHLLTKSYENVLWPNFFGNSFPHKSTDIKRQEIYDRVDRLRILRNRLAHHKPIFDRKPNAEFQNILELLSWICTDTRWLVVTMSRVTQTINERPTV